MEKPASTIIPSVVDKSAFLFKFASRNMNQAMKYTVSGISTHTRALFRFKSSTQQPQEERTEEARVGLRVRVLSNRDPNGLARNGPARSTGS